MAEQATLDALAIHADAADRILQIRQERAEAIRAALADGHRKAQVARALGTSVSVVDAAIRPLLGEVPGQMQLLDEEEEEEDPPPRRGHALADHAARHRAPLAARVAGPPYAA